MEKKIEPPIRGEFMTPKEVAKKLSICLQTVYEMITNNELPCHRIRCSIRFDSADVDDYIFFSKHHSGNLRLSDVDKEQIKNRFEDQLAHTRNYIDRFINVLSLKDKAWAKGGGAMKN